MCIRDRIRVESEPGKGTVFRLYFPLTEPETEERKAAGHKPAVRFVVVDDDPELSLIHI